jgi:hypothetical protein
VRRFVFAVFVFSLSSPLWSATIHVCDTGTNTSPYETWAKAATAFNTAVAAWSTSDEIWVCNTHSETQATTLTIDSSNDSYANPIPIYSMTTGDVYTPATVAQIEVTGATTDISWRIWGQVHGIYFKTGDDFLIESTDTGWWAKDTTIELTANDSGLKTQGNRASFYMQHGKVDFSHASGGSIWCHAKQCVFDDVEFAGGARAAGLFYCASSVPSFVRLTGGDLTAMSGEIILDASGASGSDCQMELWGVDVPASYTDVDGAFNGGNQLFFLSGTDSSGAGEGKSWQQLLKTVAGTVDISASVYLDTGLTFSEDSTAASIHLTPIAATDEWPLCTWLFGVQWISSTGSKTFTVQLIEDYPSDLNKSDVWLELFYMATANDARFTLDSSRNIQGSTALTAGDGLAAWTGEPASSSSWELATTVTVNEVGYVGGRVCVGTFSSGDSVYVDGEMSVS